MFPWISLLQLTFLFNKLSDFFCKYFVVYLQKVEGCVNVVCVCMFVRVRVLFVGDSNKPSGFRSVKAPSSKIGSSVGNAEMLPTCDKCGSGVV